MAIKHVKLCFFSVLFIFPFCHSEVSLSENLNPSAVQMFPGHDGWTGVSPPGPAAMLSMQSAPSPPGASRSESEPKPR